MKMTEEKINQGNHLLDSIKILKKHLAEVNKDLDSISKSDNRERFKLFGAFTCSVSCSFMQTALTSEAESIEHEMEQLKNMFNNL